MEFRFLLAANFNVFRNETKNKIFEHVKVMFSLQSISTLKIIYNVITRENHSSILKRLLQMSNLHLFVCHCTL